MVDNLPHLSQQARIAVQQKEWTTVAKLAQLLQREHSEDPEGHFLLGLAHKAAKRIELAIESFDRALKLGSQRYDAAIELANLHLMLLRHSDAFILVNKYQQFLTNSPLYLDMAGNIYTGLGLHSKAWPLYVRANELQPNIDRFRANLAACGVLLGKAKESKAIYSDLLVKYPQHQQNHYEFSKLERAANSSHIDQMQAVLARTNLPPEKNIFMYYAIGKELEDLGRWKESFNYYQRAGEAVLSVANYDVSDEIKVLDKIRSVCNAGWLAEQSHMDVATSPSQTPIFIVGLPRTGTTLAERIISSHSQVESADETFFMQLAVRNAAGVGGIGEVSPTIIESASLANIDQIASKYMASIEYRLSDRSMFIDKYPYNFLYLGFIAKAFPNARIVYLKRNPMDACFAMFKQSFFKFAYSLEDLGRYYVAQDELRKHWESVLGDRLIELSYESLVTAQESQTRGLLDKLGLNFELACLEFEKNPASSATASTLQVREKVHTRSLNKWQNYAKELEPLRRYLEEAGIVTD